MTRYAATGCLACRNLRSRGRRGGLALAVAASLTPPALAQIIPTGTPAADILLSQAIAEHRTFLTCSTLDPAFHALVVQGWQRDVAAAAATLAANAVPTEAITAFTTAAAPANLLPAPETPFEDVRQLCDSQPDWQTRYSQLNLIFLGQSLPRVFE